MSSKFNIITIGILLISIIISSVICFFIPTIKINIIGLKNQTILIGQNYEELGAEVYFKSIFNKKELDYETVGKVDTSNIGKYVITYKTSYNGITKEAIRIINVVDNVKPTILVNKEIKACKKNNLIEMDVSAYDDYDGDLSNEINYKLKNNKIYLKVTDSSNNKTEIIKNIKYIDDEKPTITLNGASTIYLSLNSEYEELGAIAYDSCDGNITDEIKINGEVDVSVAGTYKILYKITDSLGNESKVIRNVIVQSDITNYKYPIAKNGTIYLTFDDGPGKYTEKVLDILSNYNIKATFFVTNQFPEYQYVIGKESENGHSVGIHTYSHKWSIYESVDSYLEDFNKIKDIIVKETGVEPKIFRFPGGSSNTVSKNYCKGIMTTLSKVMTEKGYTYFDWTFDSGDTNKKNNSTKTIIKNIKNNLKGDGEYVILMHDIKKNTLEALPEIIEFALEHGYKFSSLNESSPTEHFKLAN